MIVLLPISRFLVEYEVGLGRPYSAMEWMVLRCVGEGIASVEELQETLGMHPRLIVEALVTLTRAGWLAVGAADQPLLLVTAEGHAAIADNKPPTSLQTEERSAYVLLERLTGAIVAVSDLGVRYMSRRELESHQAWEKYPRLPAKVADNRIDESVVPAVLRREKGEWLRWVGPITMVSKESHWLPLSVDMEAGTVANLPAAWEARLRPHVLSATARLTGVQQASIPVAAVIPEQRDSPNTSIDTETSYQSGSFNVRVERDDWLLSARAHREYLARALDEARSSIQIVSAFATVACLETLRAAITAAIARGVYVELLWGYEAPVEAVAWCRKLDFDCKRDGLTGAIRYNTVPSNSHAKLLLTDRGGQYEAVVGSHNWLSAPPDAANAVEPPYADEVSLRIRHAGALADVGRSIASFWRAMRNERLSSTADRSRRLAAEFSRLAVEPSQRGGDDQPTNATLRIVRDREHEHLARAWFAGHRTRFLVASHRIGPAAETRMVSSHTEDASLARVLDVRYGREAEDPRLLERVAALVTQHGGRLGRQDRLHAKVLISDDSACVSSYNFLSADAFATATNAREVGVVISGREPTAWLAAAVFPAAATGQRQ